MTDRLHKITSPVDTSVSDNVLNEWLSLKDTDKKLLALLTIRQKIDDDSISISHYFDIAKRLLSDTDNDCKWQSFIIVGHFMQTKPDECWQIIIHLGDNNDEDTRAAVATILLEHFFEENPHLFNSKFKELKQAIKEGHLNLLKTLRLCRSEWGGELNHITVDRFIKRQKSSV